MVNIYPYKNQIFLVGRHQGVRRRFVSSVYITSSQSPVVAGRCIEKTYVDLVRFVSPESGNNYLPSASLPNGDLLHGG